MLILDLAITPELDTLPIGFGCRLRLREKLAVVLDKTGSHGVLA